MPDFGSIIPRRRLLACGSLLLIPFPWGCSPEGSGTVQVPEDRPEATSTKVSDKVRTKTPGPQYEAMPRGPNQVKGGRE